MQMNIKSIPAIPFQILAPLTFACILSQHHPLIVKDNFTEFIVSFKHFRTQSSVSIYVLPLLGCRIRLGLYSRNVLNKTFLYLQNVVA